jgi:hypothetical protein
MEKYYALLGVLPTATTEEIEEAYQNKKREHATDRFEQGTLEWVRAFATLKELDTAYNNAIMATFAPIQAFSGPMPKLATPQDGMARPWLAGTPQTETAQQSQQAPQPQQIQQPRPQPVEAASPAPPVRPQQVSPSFVDPELEGLVEEVPVSFSDKDLLNMDISELRQSYVLQEKEPESFTLGIQDRLLRYYVKAYLVFAFFELIMRLSLGAKWVGALNSFNHYSIILETMENMSLVEAISESSPSVLTWIVSAFVSTAYLFCCSLPMPIVTRFFILGRPPENSAAQGTFALLSLVVALVLYLLTGFLFRFLPLSWAGCGMSLAFIAPTLCWGTMRYEGN